MSEKEISRKVIEKEIINTKTICDKCGKDVLIGMYDAFNFDLEIKTGDSYPEGGSGKSLDMDLCLDCVEGFKKLLNDNGYKLIESEWDF